MVLISFEGVDGSGKSSVMDYLKNYYLKFTKIEPLFFAEPGGTALGMEVRKIIKSTTIYNNLSALMLILAARAELFCTHIATQLNTNRLIFLDRYMDSTLVYQGLSKNTNLNLIIDMHKQFNCYYVTNLTFIFIAQVNILQERIRTRKNITSAPDIFDNLKAEDLENLQQNFLKLPQILKNNNYVIIDTSRLTLQEVCTKVMEHINKLQIKH